jgi:hypothetical protein
MSHRGEGGRDHVACQAEVEDAVRGQAVDELEVRGVLTVTAPKARCWPASVSLTWTEYRPLHDGTSMRAD